MRGQAGRRLIPVTLRKILHVDMDAFYASVEQRDDPTLVGRPVAVGGRPTHRGVVCAASYEARQFGVRSAIPMSRAVRLCPELVILPPNFPKYGEVSRQVFEIFRTVTPLVEPLSLDEAYLDVTENAWGEPLGVEVARRLKARIREETRLTASAGVAPNKFLAKIASGWKKPDGLTVISPDRIERFLQEQPVDALWGVGPKTAARLRAAGIHRLVDVRAAPEEVLRSAVGSWAEGLRRLAHGDDDRGVEPNRERKSVGSEETFARDIAEIERVREEVAALAEHTAKVLGRKSLVARTVVLKLRYANFKTLTRSHTEDPPTRDAETIAARALALLEKTEAGKTPVRLLGVSVHGLSEDGDGDAAEEPASAAADAPQLDLPVE
ncbi:MAG TPA: DNA polymerase IV [Thermoanaerobaculia bacterium]|jgi:DNA polymerase-4|nr:DNA polymerase IV [Thermoanaerobaculia bacterium]